MDETEAMSFLLAEIRKFLLVGLDWWILPVLLRPVWKGQRMVDEVRDSYDAMAEQYTAFALAEFDSVHSDRDRLAAFADLVVAQDGPVADLGCGPGYVTNYLTGLGVNVVGYDISPALIAEAKRAHPNGEFHVGDFSSLDFPDASLSGILSRYSLIHTPPSELPRIFSEWQRAIRPGAPALLSFFASSSAQRHGMPFDHAVATAYELFPATIVRQLEDAGWGALEVTVHGPIEGARPLDHAAILARKIGG